MTNNAEEAFKYKSAAEVLKLESTGNSSKYNQGRKLLHYKPAGEFFKTDPDASEKYVDKRISNVKSDLIEITHDKLENILLKHLQQLKRRKEWVTPLSLSITLLITTLTVTFNDLILKAEEWKALFIFFMIGTSVWLLYSFYLLYIYRNSATIETLIDKIKAVNK